MKANGKGKAIAGRLFFVFFLMNGMGMNGINKEDTIEEASGKGGRLSGDYLLSADKGEQRTKESR